MLMQYLICARTGHFADDVSTRCAHCDAPIMHRPQMAANLVKICEGCAATLMVTDEISQVRVTPETLREAALFNATTKGKH